MGLYVYESPAGDVDFIKDGFSWPAFFFGWVWACVKGVWGRAAILFGIFVVFGLLNSVVGLAARGSGGDGVAFFVMLFSFGVSIWVGSSGNEWRAESLLGRGWRKVAWIDESDADSAKAWWSVDRARFLTAPPGVEGSRPYLDVCPAEENQQPLHEDTASQVVVDASVDESQARSREPKGQLVSSESDRDGAVVNAIDIDVDALRRENRYLKELYADAMVKIAVLSAASRDVQRPSSASSSSSKG